jgi:Tfp pilus assembly protein PilO
MSSPDLKSLRLRIDAVGVVVGLLLTGAVFMLGVKPVLDREADRAAQRQAVSDQQREADRVTATLTVMRNNLGKFREAVQASSIQLRNTSYLNQRVGEITALATAAGLQVDEVVPGSVSAAGRYDMVPIELAGSGAFAACAKLLNELHGAFPDVGVSSLEIAGKPAAPMEPATYRIGLTWYAAPRPAAATASAQR